MKKVLLISAGAFAVSVNAQTDIKLGAPTVYGKINKEMSYIDQDDEARKTFSGLRDVDNSETRLGVKGNIDVNEITASYALEIGLNSSHSSDSSLGRLRMRLAEISFNTKFGKLVAGQTYSPMSKKALTLDPLSNTILGVAHSDQKDIISGGKTMGKGGLGAIYRSRVDLISYTTPTLAGFNYSVSADKDNDMSNDSTDPEYGATSYEHMIDFTHKVKDLKFNLFISYQATAYADQEDNTDLFYGFKAAYKNFELAFAMTNSEVKAGGRKQEVDKMIGALAYQMNQHKVAFTYQKAEDDNGLSTVNDEITQLALGYKYALNKNIELRATVGTYEYKNTTVAGNDNDATIASIGTEFKF